MPLTADQFTVLGAGVAGLATALALARKGARVTVLEQADAIREVGAGLQIGPNGGRVLTALGLGEVLAGAAQTARAIRLVDGPTGRPVLTMDLAALRPGQDYRFVHRADLIAMLLLAAEDAGVELQLLQRIDAVDLTGASPRLTTAQGATRVCGVLIGADGIGSRVRTALNGPEAPFFTHQVAWRALIPAEPDAAPEVEVHMAPGRHLVSYPLRGGSMRNIVAVEERRTWAAEGWTLRDDPAELRLAFGRFCPRVRGWLDRVEEVHLWGLFRHRIARRWHGGGAVIVGDAAHPALPFLAQGASMALEDAVTLANALDRHGTVAGAFDAYRTARAARTARIVAASGANARAYHLAPPLRAIAHAALRLGGVLAPGMALRRFDWLYDFDATL